MIAGIIILYYPKVEELDRLLRSVVNQVNLLFVVDNTPVPTIAVAELVSVFKPSAKYIPLGDNVGIAAAQNIGIRKAIAAACSHVLLLDQDSVLPPSMVSGLLAGEEALLRKGHKVAAVGPQFIDDKSGRACPAIRHRWLGIQKTSMDSASSEPIETDHIIASGAMIRVSVLEQIDLMREDFFIDWVDIEWCMRAQSIGYYSFYIPSVVMKHSVGDSIATIFGRDIHIHNNIRNYYMLRNAIYLLRLKSMNWRWRINILPRIPCYMFLYPLLSRNKRRNMQLVFKALLDGIVGHLGKIGSTLETP